MITRTKLYTARRVPAAKSWASHDLAVYVAVGCAIWFALVVAGPGVPWLRHDWVWITDRRGFADSAFATLGGWRPEGIGSARQYPSDYLMAIVDIIIVAIIGPRASFVVIVALIAFACAYGGMRLTRALSEDRLAAIAGAIAASFNPWVYCKLVAGHIFMLLAYAATMLLLSEMLGRRRPYYLALFLILTAEQSQMFFPAFGAAIAYGIWRRSYVPVLVAGIVGSPTIVGIALNQTSLVQTPYNLPWQISQSVPPMDAAALGGYFAGYGNLLGPFGFAPMWGMLAIALVGVIFSRSRILAFCIAGAGLTAWLVASGVRGPLGQYYASLVVAVPESGLYRELYDVVGFLAIAYVALCAVATQRFKSLAWPWLACALVLPIGWCVHSPWTFWVNAFGLPTIRVQAPENTRFALLPPFQPLLYDGRGSGIDPDAYPRRGNVTPLNTPLEAYPMNVALDQYVKSDRTDMLAALSVSSIISRDGYQMVSGSLAPQLAQSRRETPTFDERRRSMTLRASPELEMLALLPATSFAGTLGAGRIFFGDAALAKGNAPALWRSYRPTDEIPIDRQHLQPSDGWVDVRQAFLTSPELAQGLGGAMTTSPTALLPIRRGVSLLAYVRGRMLDQDGRAFEAANGGYRWIAPPRGTRFVRCLGVCAVAAEGTVPSGLAPDEPAKSFGALAFQSWAPWLVSATLPRSSEDRLLRYNVAFDGHWVAFAGSRSLLHVRVDSVMNGWVVPRATAERRLVLVETSALVQAILEIAGICTSLYVLARVVLPGCVSRTRSKARMTSST